MGMSIVEANAGVVELDSLEAGCLPVEGMVLLSIRIVRSVLGAMCSTCSDCFD